MKKDHLLVAVALLAFAVSPVFAQGTRPAAPTTAPAQSAAVPESKIALIYSDAFLDSKTGIAKFNALMTTLNREFQPRQTELNQLATQIQQLEEDIKKTQPVAAPAATQAKIDQLEQKRKEAQRKKEDAEAAYERRQREVFAPLQEDIGKALEAYAKQRGINVIIDGSRVPLVYAADSIDITRGFIAEFNSKNPATASVTPPQ
ncbi:MAG TPA: OmpH family outer membrane protein [Pyrinomonadaceae bacterium]|jgi:outer membrane protein